MECVVETHATSAQWRPPRIGIVRAWPNGGVAAEHGTVSSQCEWFTLLKCNSKKQYDN